MDLWPIVLMLALFALNVPVTFAIGLSALAFFAFAPGVPMDIFAQRLVAVTDSFPLLAVPLFVLAGAIMNAGGITRRLLSLADALVGHMAGALAQTCIVLATLLGGLTASASADAALLAKTLGPDMVTRGYSPAFAAVITSCASISTALIPPSIALVIYGYLADASVGRLFLAGIVPGLVISGFLMATTYFVAKRRNYVPVRAQFVGRAELGRRLRDASWALSIPVFIVLGLRYGVFTPTESGAIIVVYAMMVGFFQGDLRFSQLPTIISETVVDSSIVMLVVATSSALGFYMAWEQLPPQMAAWVVALTDNPWLLLFLINILLVVLGMPFEGTALLIILTPIFVPVIAKLGIDPVHFGIIFVTNIVISGVTPPVGQMMFISCAVLRVPMKTYSIEVLPFLGAMLLALALITFVPQVSLFLPNLLMGPG